MEITSDINPFQSPGSKQLTAWALRMTQDQVFRFIIMTDAQLFSLFYACCAAAVPVPENKFLNKEKNSLSEPNNSNKLMETLKELKYQFGETVSGQFAALYLQGFELYTQLDPADKEADALFSQWKETAEEEAFKYSGSIEKNIDFLVPIIGLSELEKNLLLFQIYQEAPGFSQLFSLILRMDHIGNQALAKVLDVNSSDLDIALKDESVLVRSGLLRVSRRPLRISPLSNYFRATFYEEYANAEEFFKNFVIELKSKETTQSLARFEAKDKEIILKLLKTKIEKDHPINLLIYGNKAIDKLSLVSKLCEDDFFRAYKVVSNEVPASDMSAWAFIGQKYLEKNRKGSILVIDRVEEVLASKQENLFASLFGMAEEGSSEEERASDSGLTNSELHCIWLSDNSNALSEKSISKFIFHCQAHPGSRSDRRDRIKEVVSEYGLSKDLEKELSKYSLLGEHQVRQAAKLSSLISEKEADKEEPLHADQIMRRAISQSQIILGREETEDLRDSVTAYSLDNLNIAGKFKPEQIIKSLQKKQKSKLLFYGIPGTGKTQLAEYMAVELDMPLLIKRASDILSKWVGESEKNIAAMFAEAEAEGAILFVDEADSFLRDRELAKAEWNVSQVNELLQQMERFDGIFIAATNLFEDLDKAVLRRFVWKLEFKELRKEQAWNMFEVEAGIRGKRFSKAKKEAWKESLAEIEFLTPGDFATVKRQANMLDEVLSPDEWVEQLQLEAKAKMHGLTRKKFGFKA